MSSILLIDDEETFNFLHTEVIRRMGPSNEVISFYRAIEAHSYLESIGTSGRLWPDVIFLDINMPGINGWELVGMIDKSSKIPKDKLSIYMLSSSINPEDVQRADELDFIKGFVSKPLSREKVWDILMTGFSKAG